MTNPEIKTYLKMYWDKLSNEQLALGMNTSQSSVRRWAKKLGLPNKPPGGFKEPVKKLSVKEQIQIDTARRKKVEETHDDKKKYQFLGEENKKLRKELDAALHSKANISPVVYHRVIENNTSESVAVVLASDWHIEENVKPDTVNGLNEFNLSVAHKRVEQFFQTIIRFTEIEQKATKIDTLVLALLGDFISGNIHEALLEICEEEPIDAMIIAENMILGGIKYLLDNSKLNLIIPCHVGNHSRITKKVHIATETGNSLETIMYHHIKNHFKGNKRVEVLISPSYLSYIDLWGYTICFSHGHAVKFQGGIGGLTIPLRKAVNEWQENRRADLYCIGHWHQFLDIGEAIVNGSLCGYNTFAMFIKARYQKPKQAFFIINKKFREKVVVRSILFNV